MSQPSLSDLVSLVQRREPQCGVMRVVLVDGPAGSGKTTLANRLSLALGGQESEGAGTYDPDNPTPDDAPVQILHSDDMYEGWGGLPILDRVLVDQVLEPLSRGVGGEFAMWDWLLDERTHTIRVPQRRYLIVEGVGVAQRSARPYASTVIYVDAPWPERLRRGMERDGESLRPQWEAWHETEDEFLYAEGTLHDADAVVSGDTRLPDSW
ncbi:uridine kinase [Demequina sp.]|uniref:uridine kinase family protein n=1 Tax=Demequina sp. TaxID=2050685 RepID=UPI0025C32D61|nr:uridine kinase [Demequina sp.]